MGCPLRSRGMSAAADSGGNGPVTTLPVDVPEVKAGNAVHVHITTRVSSTGGPLVTLPDGTWRVLRNAVSASVFGVGVFVKKYDADAAAGTVNFTTSDNVKYRAQIRVVSLWGGDIDNDVLFNSAGSPGTTDTPDPPKVDLPSGAEKALSIAGVSWWTAPATVSSYPFGYSGGISSGTSGGGSEVGIGSAWVNFEASSENPGVFTLSEDEGWLAATTLFRPLS